MRLGRPDVDGGQLVTPSPAAARRRLRKSAGTSLPWRFYAAQIYERALYVAVFGGITVQLVRSAIEESGQGFDPAQAPLIDRTGVTFALSVLAFSVLLKALLAIGPISASAATATWLLGSPLDRRRSLLSRYFLALLLSSVAGLLWPGFAFLLTGFGIRISGTSVLISGTVAAACVGLAVCIQTSRRTVAGVCRSALTVSASVSALVLVVDVMSDGRFLGSVRLDTFVGQLVPVAFFVAPAAALLLTAMGIHALGRLERSSFSSGRAVAVGLTLSVTSFEFGLLGSIMTERRATQIGRVRSLPVGGRSWVLSVIAADLVRLSRAPGKLLAVGCLLLVPALFGSGASGPMAEFVPAVFTLAAFLVADRLAGTQRIVIRSAGVRRLLGLPRRKLSAGLTVVPLVGTTIWCCVAAALTDGISLANIVAAGLGSVVVVYRISTRDPLSFDDTSFIDFGAMGPAPLGLLKQLSRGPTLLLFLMLVQILVL